MTESPLQKKRVQTSFGEIAYLESGSAKRPTVLFVHGIPTSGWLWRHVLRFGQDDIHGIAPDLMGLGDTRVAAGTRLDMEAQSEMLADFMTALGHERFVLVCHDQGGAAAQLFATRFPERVEALILTNCVAFDNWPVPAIRRLQAFVRTGAPARLAAAAGLIEWLETSTPASNFRRGVYERDRLTDEAIAEYLKPLREGSERRERFFEFLLAGHERYTQMTVTALGELQTPTLVLWAADDAYLSPSWGKMLFEHIPGAKAFELIPFCGHFWPEERPAEFASHILRFVKEQRRAQKKATGRAASAQKAPRKPRRRAAKPAAQKASPVPPPDSPPT